MTDLFIKHTIELGYRDLPTTVQNQTTAVLLDFLGVTIGGRKFLKEKHPDIIANMPSEPFLNGFAAHVLELDDGHRHGMIHLGASIVSAVLEVAKKEGLKSDNVLRGIVMGYEVAVRCARATQSGHKVYVL